MACLDTYANERNKSQFTAAPIGPRISFSSDFPVSDQETRIGGGDGYREAPVSSDFEFLVADFSIASADELFFKGRLLPLKEAPTRSVAVTTLRDELMADVAEEEAEFVGRPSFPPMRWRGFFGMKKATVSKNFGLVSQEGNSTCIIPRKQVEDERVDGENGTGLDCMDTDTGL
ncbi:hypothetical protein MLD38_030908 [Melastoma candidum]|uniref:Uncharacterized protein n=1 Tax=Melastoma candidum TaxID=119954 RepID=A0ACB9MT49_9MYRT|nr:hypothetical protein MLD38_030908 [Melastoma candidum]